MGKGGTGKSNLWGVTRQAACSQSSQLFMTKRKPRPKGSFSQSLSLSFSGYAQDLASGVWWTDGWVQGRLGAQSGGKIRGCVLTAGRVQPVWHNTAIQDWLDFPLLFCYRWIALYRVLFVVSPPVLNCISGQQKMGWDEQGWAGRLGRGEARLQVKENRANCKGKKDGRKIIQTPLHHQSGRPRVENWIRFCCRLIPSTDKEFNVMRWDVWGV